MQNSYVSLEKYIPHESLLETLFDGVYYVDRDRNVAYWNAGAERITGYGASEVVGRGCGRDRLEHVDENGKCRCDAGCPLQLVLEKGVPVEMDIFLHHRDGHRVPVSVRTSPVRDEAGSIVGAVEVFSEIPHRVSLLSELQKLRRELYEDPLTMVGNKRFADLTLDARFAELRDNRVPFGVLLYDIGLAHELKSAYGQNMLDRLLVMTARTINAGLRDMDVLCRWADGEFIVFVPDGKKASMSSIAERTSGLVRNAFLHHGGERLEVSCSVGGTVARAGDTPASITKRAHDMLASSRKEGRNRFHFM